MSKFLQIHPEDNVVVCLQEMKKGDTIVLSDGRNVNVTGLQSRILETARMLLNMVML